MRTLMQLYVDGCVEEYRNIFDINMFRKNKKKYLQKMQYRKSAYDMEIFQTMIEKGKKPNLGLRVLIIRPIYLLWQKMKTSKIIMGIFYKFNLDYMLYGRAMAESIRYSKGIAFKSNRKKM